jgi:hypothetical protein
VSFHGLDDWCDSQQGQGLYCHVWCFLSLSWEAEALDWCWDYRCMELYLCVHICLDGIGLNTGGGLHFLSSTLHTQGKLSA